MNILQRICDKITRHKACKLTEVVAAVTPDIYVYKCSICGEDVPEGRQMCGRCEKKGESYEKRNIR